MLSKIRLQIELNDGIDGLIELAVQDLNDMAVFTGFAEDTEDDDNDWCPRCGQTPCLCQPMHKQATPPPGPVNKYRKP
jgi:hypothetical protein